jgi:hypothetical protein
VYEKDTEYIDIAFANPPSMNPAYAAATEKVWSHLKYRSIIV